MLNLRTAAKKRVNSYFATPKSMYEKFVNKKWDERAKIHASKQDFIKVTISEWKSLSEQERIQFLSKKAPERPREKTVLDFFRKKNPDKSSPIENNQSNEDFTCSSKSATSSDIRLPNAGEKDCLGRETFLLDREKAGIKLFLESFQPELIDDFFAAKDIINDKSFMSALTALVYKWKKYNDLLISYEKGKTREKEART